MNQKPVQADSAVLEVFSKSDVSALRRGVDPWEVRGFYQLIKKYPEFSPPLLAMAAPLVAEIRETVPEKIGVIAKQSKLSERRLRRLLGSRDRIDLIHQLRGLVRIAKRRANPDDVVRTVVYWGNNQRRRIAQDYFGDNNDD